MPNQVALLNVHFSVTCLLILSVTSLINREDRRKSPGEKGVTEGSYARKGSWTSGTSDKGSVYQVQESNTSS